MTVYINKGFLKAEYNAMTLNRYKIVSDTALPTGKVKIEVKTFDVGVDPGSPVALDYFDRAPFKFNVSDQGYRIFARSRLAA